MPPFPQAASAINHSSMHIHDSIIAALASACLDDVAAALTHQLGHLCLGTTPRQRSLKLKVPSLRDETSGKLISVMFEIAPSIIFTPCRHLGQAPRQPLAAMAAHAL